MRWMGVMIACLVSLVAGCSNNLHEPIAEPEVKRLGMPFVAQVVTLDECDGHLLLIEGADLDLAQDTLPAGYVARGPAASVGIAVSACEGSSMANITQDEDADRNGTMRLGGQAVAMVYLILSRADGHESNALDAYAMEAFVDGSDPRMRDLFVDYGFNALPAKIQVSSDGFSVTANGLSYEAFISPSTVLPIFSHGTFRYHTVGLSAKPAFVDAANPMVTAEVYAASLTIVGGALEKVKAPPMGITQLLGNNQLEFAWADADETAAGQPPH